MTGINRESEERSKTRDITATLHKAMGADTICKERKKSIHKLAYAHTQTHKSHLYSLPLIVSLSALRPGFDYQGQFGTFLFPLKCGVGNGKSSLASKVPKTP